MIPCYHLELIHRFHILQNLSFVTLLLCRGLCDFKQNKHAYFCFTCFSFHLWKFMKLLVSIWSAIFDIWKGPSNWKTCSFKYWLLLILNKDDVIINLFHFVGFKLDLQCCLFLGGRRRMRIRFFFQRAMKKSNPSWQSLRNYTTSCNKMKEIK